jgi:hypothetical protein
LVFNLSSRYSAGKPDSAIGCKDRCLRGE